MGINLIDLPDASDSNYKEFSKRRALNYNNTQTTRLNRRQRGREPRSGPYSPKTFVRSGQSGVEHSLHLPGYPVIPHDHYIPNKPPNRPETHGGHNIPNLPGSPVNPKQPGQSESDDRNENVESKIKRLVQKTMHDTKAKIDSIDYIKEAMVNMTDYRTGVVLSSVKKARDDVTMLFNIAIRNRDSWKALEQLSIFEIIVHSAVDTADQVQQLTQMHAQTLKYSSSTSVNLKKL